MRLWHEALIPHLPRQQLLGQHRECCALRGNGWGKPHATVNYVFDHPSEWLYAYHILVMNEMLKRGYSVEANWASIRYRGKVAEPYSKESVPNMNKEVNRKLSFRSLGQPIYPEHNDEYLKECLDNLAVKGIVLEVDRKMASERRLIDANALIEKFRDHKDLFLNKMGGFQALLQREKGRVDELDNCIADVINAPTVDAIPVDEIQVDIVSLSLENQEAVLSVSICGKPNEVKLPFSKEVAEVVHGHWTATDVIIHKAGYGVRYYYHAECKVNPHRLFECENDYCPNCGAAMKEEPYEP